MKYKMSIFPFASTRCIGLRQMICCQIMEEIEYNAVPEWAPVWEPEGKVEAEELVMAPKKVKYFYKGFLSTHQTISL